MKGNKLFTGLTAASLSFAVSFGGIACVATGFELPGVSLPALALWCCLFSLWAAGCLCFRRGGTVLAAGTALLMTGLLCLGDLYDSAGVLLFRISHRYDAGYHWGYLMWKDADPSLYTVDTALFALSTISAALTARCICRQKRILLPTIAGLLNLTACMVVVDTVPAGWCICLLLTALVLLLLTGAVRRRSLPDGNRLTALILIPTLLAMWLLFWAVPKDGQDFLSGRPQFSLPTWLQGLFGSSEEADFGAVDLSALGPKPQSSWPVMEVTAAVGGSLYLRGQSLDTYTGKVWDASVSSNGEDTGWPSRGLTEIGTVKITTWIRAHEQLYTPYYTAGDTWMVYYSEGRVENPSHRSSYSFTQYLPIGDPTGVSLRRHVQSQCLQLPLDTENRALLYLQLHNLPTTRDLPARQVAEQIRNHVKNTAGYDLNAPAMPSYETDFAMWFLEHGSVGYCVHFATAAVVLLRAAGVPARYVSGYLCQGTAGRPVSVTVSDAHAWVEYFDPAIGWCVLDPTPSAQSTPEPTVPSTGPDNTIPSTQTTAPSTGSDNTTQATQATGPSPTVSTTGSTGNGDAQTADLTPLWICLQGLIGLIAMGLMLWGQYALRRSRRKKRTGTGPANARALALWQEILCRSRILKQTPPPDLLELAEKAKFSQHTLTAQERQSLAAHLNRLDGELAQKPLLLRLWLGLIFAV